MLERIVVGAIFGIPGMALIIHNYYRIISKKPTSGSPAYIIGGIFGAVGVLAFLGSDIKSRWYLILIPIILDWGLCVVSFVLSLLGFPKRDDMHQDE